MRKLYFLLGSVLVIGLGIGIYFFNSTTEMMEEDEMPKRTRTEELEKWRNEITKDPALGYVPHERMLNVFRRIEALEAGAASRTGELTNANWRERGPYSVAGRTRAIMIDKADPTGNTVFTAGVTGGLWRTKSIASTTPNWEQIGHFFSNINISAIDQDKNNPNIIYFGTGEPHGGAGRGLGLWKSTDGGDNWTHLPSTINSSFYYVVRLFVHPLTNDVYAATESGLQRSQDGGSTWQVVLGNGISFGTSNRITDIEYAADGTMYVSLGHGGASNIYRTDPGAAQGNVGNWTRLTSGNTGFPTGRTRIELSVAPSDANIIYAVTAVGGDGTGIYRSLNRGTNWLKTSDAPGAFGMPNFTRGQAGYDLDICVNPTNENHVIIGGIDLLESKNGGQSWTQISQWYGGGGFQEVHADQHRILFDLDRPGRVLFGNDGGIFYSTNNGTTIRNRNNGYNVTQFYALAMHPDTFSNYFLAGAQDNGTQQFNQFDIANTNEVIGGDGFMCHIDQNEPNIQFGSVYEGDWRVSTDGGQNFGAMRSNDVGSGFYTPSDYDNDANILYTQGRVEQNIPPGEFFRFEVSKLGSSGYNGDFVDITGFNNNIRHVYASDNTDNRIYIGSDFGRIIKIDNAHTGASATGTSINISTNGSISSIVEEDGNGAHLIATISNYGSNSVWESTNGGNTWISIEGDLPDMPVNWAAFHPYDNDKLVLATDAGVWTTEDINGANTNWLPATQMPIVRTDMLQIRKSDGLIAAATYGRGIFTTDFLSPSISKIDIDRVAYLNTPIRVHDNSVNPYSWVWDFGNGDSSTDQNPSYNYSSIGVYNIKLTVNDSAISNEILKVLPDRTVPYISGEVIYGGDFETTEEDFGVDTKSGTAWVKGNSTIFGKSGTTSGSSAWVTGLSNNLYANNTETYLYTPNFDLSEPAIYELKFNGKFNIQDGFDGLRVEYSTDRGQTWQQLGQYNEDIPEDANLWYNYKSDNPQTAFPIGSAYFTGLESEWKEFKTDLNVVQGESNVAFRFAFRSNNFNTRAGAAIDDFQITKYDDILETILRSFTGEFTSPNSNEVLLNWTTQPEYNCAHFKVFVSENGKDYIEFDDKLIAQGSTADASSYNFTIINRIKDIYYFKIKVVDFDGNFFMSDVVVVNRNDDNAIQLAKIYPNPVGDYLDLAFTQFVEEKIVVNIYDTTGKLILSEGRVPNDVYIRLATNKLHSGVYILVIEAGGNQIVEKIIKK